MAQFDVFKNQNPDTKKFYPLLLDMQSDLLGDLNTRIVAPMTTDTNITEPISKICPLTTVRNKAYWILPQEMAAVSIATLGDRVANLAAQRNELTSAIDLIFTGA
ncbi:MAG: CcdB family protein [Gammaproteobacteria bacterium]|nr:CcdB family protein [Gammaproteobacteria bacterium]